MKQDWMQFRGNLSKLLVNIKNNQINEQRNNNNTKGN
jgi:hypothetical protein